MQHATRGRSLTAPDRELWWAAAARVNAPQWHPRRTGVRMISEVGFPIGASSFLREDGMGGDSYENGRDAQKLILTLLWCESIIQTSSGGGGGVVTGRVQRRTAKKK